METLKARLAANGYRDPDLRTGNVDTAGCASRRSSHLRLISLGALEKWLLWSLDIKNAFLLKGGFDCEVYLRAPRGRNTQRYSPRMEIAGTCVWAECCLGGSPSALAQIPG